MLQRNCCAGDVDQYQAIIAETMKLIGNVLYGHTAMDEEKHTTTYKLLLLASVLVILIEELGKHKIVMDTWI